MSDGTITTEENGVNHLNPSTNRPCNANNANGVTATGWATGDEIAGNGASGFSIFMLGSDDTSNCTSRYGAQDLVGNVWEWTSDQMNCNGSYVCTGAQSGLESGNTDLEGFLWDGTHGPGGQNIAGWTIDTGASTYNALYFSFPLGVPMVGTDSGNALQINTTALPSGRLHDDLYVLFTNYNTTHGLATGGDYEGSTGTGDGRWASLWEYSTYTAEGVGFRCVLPAQ
jgi:hypothetical protein